jgi:hypothetical protein
VEKIAEYPLTVFYHKTPASGARTVGSSSIPLIKLVCYFGLREIVGQTNYFLL